MKKALLVIDCQKALVEAKPYAIDACSKTWQRAIQKARSQGMEVIYVRHQDDDLVFGSGGWEIHESLTPQSSEKIVDKFYNSAFKATGLAAYLNQKGIDNLVMIGMLTNNCMDTTVRVAFELGYEVSVIEHGSTTFDDEDIQASLLIDYHESLWDGNFARVEPLDVILNEE